MEAAYHKRMRISITTTLITRGKNMKKIIFFLLASACTVCLLAGCSTDTVQSSTSQETVLESVSSNTTVSEPESVPGEEPAEQVSAAEPLAEEPTREPEPAEEPAEEPPAQTTTAQPNYGSQYNTQAYTPQETADPYADWVPYHTSSPQTLADAMAKGYVVYHNGQYLASPYYFKMLSNQKVVYFEDISSEELKDRYAAAK